MAAETPARFSQVRFPTARSRAWRGGFAEAAQLASAICAVFWSAGVAMASTSANVSGTGQPLARVFDWVLAHGVSKTVSAPVAEALHFGTAELKVKQTGYQSDDKLARLVAIPVDGSGNIIFCHLALDGSGVCWRTDKSGVLKATARVGPSGHAVSASATLSERDDFETQKTYFIKKASH